MTDLINIAIAEIKGQIDPDAEVKEQFRQAMRVAKNYWLFTDEEMRFKSAVGAVLVVRADDNLTERVRYEMRLLSAIAAAAGGVPVDFEALLPPEDEDAPEPLRLMELWREVKEEAA